MKRILVGIAVLGLLGSPSGAQESQSVDVYDYDAARVVVKLDQEVEDEFDDYVTYAKTLDLDRFGGQLDVAVQVIKKEDTEDYYTIAWITRAVDLGGQGLGNIGGLLPYSSDWDLRKETQAIYASGYGLEGALDDLEKKFNGASGQCSFSGAGDATKGELVITMLGPYSVDADGGAVRRPTSDDE